MPLTIHHLGASQSERLVWLAEELNLDYTLTLHQRDPVFSPSSIKSLHPLGQAPIIQDGPLTLSESAACTEYIIHRYGGGRLALAPSHPDYAAYLFWFHFANGNLQATFFRHMNVRFALVEQAAAAGDKVDVEGNVVLQRVTENVHRLLKYMDDALADGREWLAGKEFTAAETMCVFSLTTGRMFAPVDLSAYASVLAWLGRCVKREGYLRARAKADPTLELMVDGKPPTFFRARLEATGRIA